MLFVQGSALPALISHLNVSKGLQMGSLKWQWGKPVTDPWWQRVSRGLGQAGSGWVSSPCPVVNGALPKLEPKEHGLILPTSLPRALHPIPSAWPRQLLQPSVCHSMQQVSSPHEKPPCPAMCKSKPFCGSLPPCLLKRQPTSSCPWLNRGLCPLQPWSTSFSQKAE